MAKPTSQPSIERSRIMRAVKSRDTAPERRVRSFIHRHGARFRLCVDALPGKPDIVLPSRAVVVFVHGCFWHGHDCKRGARLPVANRAYWSAKIGRNRRRDAANVERLAELGWRVVVVWECETGAESDLRKALGKVLRRRTAI
ncbi:MAG: very short patch repair endonuclease [Hyphomicrobium sp.]